MPTSPQSRTVCVNSDDENKAALVWPLWLLLNTNTKNAALVSPLKIKGGTLVFEVIAILENLLLVDINIVFENIL